MADKTIAEVWRAVPGYEGLYSASDLGRIRSERRSKRFAPGHILSPAQQGTGYLKLTLCGVNGHKQHTVHRLIALTFLGPCPEGKAINHKDGVKTNNAASNIEYATPSENQRHRFDVLGQSHPGPEPRFGERHPHSKLTDDQVREIRKLYAGGMLQRVIGARFGIQQTHVHKIVTRRLWPHVA